MAPDELTQYYYEGPAGRAKLLFVPAAVRVRVLRRPSNEVLCDAAVSDDEEGWTA